MRDAASPRHPIRSADPSHATDPFVVDSRCRSIACIPIRRKGEVTGFVILENRSVAGAFTPQLVSLTQALVAQAAISLDNATLYDDLSTLNRELEARVDDRTRALQQAQQQLIESARKAGMADVADMHQDFILYLTRHSPLTLVESVARVSAARTLTDPAARRRAGLRPGVIRLITNLGVRDLSIDGAIRPTALWGPIVQTQVDDYAIGIVTYGGQLRMFATSYAPCGAFLDDVTATLVGILDA